MEDIVAAAPQSSSSQCHRGATVSPGVDINARTFVLLTPMADIGSRALWFTKNTSANTFTIRMGSPRGSSTKVAWLALESA